VKTIRNRNNRKQLTEKVMKTKIRTFIIICTLGLVGVLNANATLGYNTSCIAGTLEETKNVKSENLNSAEFIFNTDADAEIDYQKEAQLVTMWVADKEEAKAVKKLIDEGVFVSIEETASCPGATKSESLNLAESLFSTDAKIDYQKEAQLVTKLIADKEEAKAVQKFIDEGKLPENK
jgi:hypothetical protein